MAGVPHYHNLSDHHQPGGDRPVYVVLLDFGQAFGLLSIFVPYADSVCRKDPWNWEYDAAESCAAARKAASGAERLNL